MVAAHSLLWGNVAEYVTLLLIGSSHALLDALCATSLQHFRLFQQPARLGIYPGGAFEKTNQPFQPGPSGDCASTSEKTNPVVWLVCVATWNRHLSHRSRKHAGGQGTSETYEREHDITVLCQGRA